MKKFNKTIYRVVDQYGEGYRRGKGKLDSLINSRSIMDYAGYEVRRPLAAWEGIPKSRVRGYHRFAFADLHQYKSWFPLNQRNAGTSVGGKVQVILVNEKHIMTTPTQVIYDKRRAEVIAEVPMNHYDSELLRNQPFDEDEIKEPTNSCPGCDIPSTLTEITETITYRDHPITFNGHVFQCPTCGCEYVDAIVHEMNTHQVQLAKRTLDASLRI